MQTRRTGNNWSCPSCENRVKEHGIYNENRQQLTSIFITLLSTMCDEELAILISSLGGTRYKVYPCFSPTFNEDSTAMPFSAKRWCGNESGRWQKWSSSWRTLQIWILMGGMALTSCYALPAQCLQLQVWHLRYVLLQHKKLALNFFQVLLKLSIQRKQQLNFL